MIVYTRDNLHNFPLLVIFANRLIKMARNFYEDISTTNKYHALVNFFELFDALASAGPEIRRYLVMSEVIGRLLHIYYHKSSDEKHYYHNLSSIPTYEIFCNDRDEEISISSKNIAPADISIEKDQEVEFDYGLRVRKRKNEKDDLIVEKEKKAKERKYSSDDESPRVPIKGAKEGDEKRYAYLFRTISMLLCSCKFKLSGRYIAEDSMFLNTTTPNTLSPSEERSVDIICSERVITDWLILNSPNVSTREDI
jgi:hypothetical protein